MKFIKHIMASCISLAAMSTSACDIGYIPSGADLNRIIKENGGLKQYQNFEQLCQKLNAAGADLHIDGAPSVISGKSVAWARVSLVDKKTNFVSNDFSGSSTRYYEIGGTQEAEKILFLAIMKSLEAMDIDIDRAIAKYKENLKGVLNYYIKSK